MTYLIVGGAGFVGSHLARVLPGRVRIFDKQRGQDALDFHCLVEAMRGTDTVVHLASNPDIAKAATTPTIDFVHGTQITQNIAEAARIVGVRAVWYASGSGVYGDHGTRAVTEDGPFQPVSTYGASKLAGEAILSAYSHMFGLTVRAFRFANLVGAGQTHGVGFDFLNQLRAHPDHLDMRGDGTQSKSYLHIDDAIRAMLTVADGTGFEVFNVATDDTLTVDGIVALAAGVTGTAPKVSREPQRAGWAGDVPDVRLDSTKVRSAGWEPRMGSREAMLAALTAMV